MRKPNRQWLVWAVLSVMALSALAFNVFPLKGHIPVLMYHFVVPKSQVGTTSLDVSIDNFHRQMWFLRTFGFRPISLDEFYAIKTGQAKVRGREVVITFDDGNETYIQYALPILERYQIQSANFLVWNFMELKQNGSMSVEDAVRISQNPLITLGSHTLSHPNLQEISVEQARTEIMDSKKKLEKALNKKVHYFCYPGGSFNEITIRQIKEAGYRLAFRTAQKYSSYYPETLYSIARIKVHRRHNLFVFWLEAAGFIDYAKRMDVLFHQLTANKVSGTLPVYKPRHEMM